MSAAKERKRYEKKNLGRTMQNTEIDKHKKWLCKGVHLVCAHRRKNDDKALRKNDGKKTKNFKAINLQWPIEYNDKIKLPKTLKFWLISYATTRSIILVVFILGIFWPQKKKMGIVLPLQNPPVEIGIHF